MTLKCSSALVIHASTLLPLCADQTAQRKSTAPERNHGCPVFVDLMSVISEDEDHSFEAAKQIFHFFSSASVRSLTLSETKQLAWCVMETTKTTTTTFDSIFEMDPSHCHSSLCLFADQWCGERAVSPPKQRGAVFSLLPPWSTGLFRTARRLEHSPANCVTNCSKAK